MNLDDFPAIDQHAHNLVKPEVIATLPYADAFTEGYESDITHHHARYSLFYRRSLRDVAQLLGCEATEEAIAHRRRQLNLESLAQLCFQSSNLEAIFLDDGFLPDNILPWEWHQQFIPTQRILRLEYLAQNLIAQEDNFDTFLDRFRSEIDPIPPGVVALKSIAAYRTGLAIEIVPKELAEASFHNLKQSPQSIRLTEPSLINFLITQALEIAAKHNIPIQFHTGFGDPDLDLRYSNPLYLRQILEEKRFRNAPIILLHASYPYMREAGYLASVYPQVYLDFGLAIPYLSVAGMRSTVQQLLELAPYSKLMYSSDAHNIPELYYLGAKWGRKVLGQVLEGAINDSDLTAKEAELVAISVLSKNAQTLYS